jgi:hypothetical protein
MKGKKMNAMTGIGVRPLAVVVLAVTAVITSAAQAAATPAPNRPYGTSQMHAGARSTTASAAISPASDTGYFAWGHHNSPRTRGPGLAIGDSIDREAGTVR